MPIWTDHQVHYLAVDVDGYGLKFDRFKSDYDERLREGVETHYHFMPDVEQLALELPLLLNDLANSGFQILSVMTMQGGIGEGDARVGGKQGSNFSYGWGVGMSFNASPTTGIMVVSVQTREVSSEEHARLFRERQLPERLVRLRMARKNKERQLDQIQPILALAQRKREILSAKGKNKLMANKYVIGPYEFDNSTEANKELSVVEVQIEELVAKQQRGRLAIDRLDAEIAELEQQIEDNKRE